MRSAQMAAQVTWNKRLGDNARGESTLKNIDNSGKLWNIIICCTIQIVYNLTTLCLTYSVAEWIKVVAFEGVKLSNREIWGFDPHPGHSKVGFSSKINLLFSDLNWPHSKESKVD